MKNKFKNIFKSKRSKIIATTAATLSAVAIATMSQVFAAYNPPLVSQGGKAYPGVTFWSNGQKVGEWKNGALSGETGQAWSTDLNVLGPYPRHNNYSGVFAPTSEHTGSEPTSWNGANEKNTVLKNHNDALKVITKYGINTPTASEGQHLYYKRINGPVKVGAWALDWKNTVAFHGNHIEYLVNGGITGNLNYYANEEPDGWVAYCADCGEVIYNSGDQGDLNNNGTADSIIDTFATDSTLGINTNDSNRMDSSKYGKNTFKQTAGGLDTIYASEDILYFYRDAEHGYIDMAATTTHQCKQVSSNQYKVVYNGNGANYGETENSIHTWNDADEYDGKPITHQTTLNNNGYTRYGYEFAGWNTKADGSGTSYNEGQTVKNLTSVDNGTVTLYAQWQKSDSTLNIDTNGGTYQDKTNPSFTQGYKTTKDINFSDFANGYYTVTFNSDGGNSVDSLHANKTIDHLETVDKLDGATEIHYNGFDVDKWVYTYSGHNGSSDTIKAYWKNGAIQLPSVTKTNYAFDGWYTTGGTFVGNIGDYYTPNDNITLIAHWSGLELTSTNNWDSKANNGKGAVDLKWDQGGIEDKFYNVFRSLDKKNWTNITEENEGALSVMRTDEGKYKTATLTDNTSYTIQKTGWYKLTANGAQGATVSCSGQTATGGKGGYVTGTYYLTKGQVVSFEIGKTADGNSGGSGGLSRVSVNGTTLLVAGGGGSGTIIPEFDNNSSTWFVPYKNLNGKIYNYPKNGADGGSRLTSIGNTSGGSHYSASGSTREGSSYITLGGNGGAGAQGGNGYGVLVIDKEEVKDDYHNNTNDYGSFRNQNPSNLLPDGQTITITFTNQEYGLSGHNGYYLNRPTVYLNGVGLGLGGIYDAQFYGSGDTTTNVLYDWTDTWYVSVTSNYYLPYVFNTNTFTFSNSVTYKEQHNNFTGEDTNYHFGFVPRGVYAKYTWIKVIDAANATQAQGGTSYIADSFNGQGVKNKSYSGGTQSGNGNALLEATNIDGCFNVYADANKSRDGVAAPDNAKPDKVVANTIKTDNSDKIDRIYTWNDAKDNGTDYYWQVESINAATDAVISTSNVTKNTLTSGIASYRYLVDTDENTVLDSTMGTETSASEKQAHVNVTDKVQYLHIIAVDKNGNYSETTTIEIDPTHKLTVNYMLEQADGSYKATTKDEYSGLAGNTVKPEVKDFTGYKSPSQIQYTFKDSDDSINYYYELIPYNITYNLNDNDHTPALNATNPISYTIADEKIINEISRTAYQFTGWTGSNGSTPAKTVTIPVGSTGDKNYIANWDPTAYNITYDLGGGSITNEPKQYTVESANINIPKPTRTGYTFTGWTGSNGDTEQTSVTIPTGSYGDKSYKAHWSANTYTLTYDGNGGKASKISQTAKYDSAWGTLATSSRTGYIFSGWYTSKTDGNEVTKDTICKGDLTAYAHWTPINYKIHYDGNKSTSGSMSDTVATYDKEVSLTANAFTRHGYTFTGWNLAADGSGKSFKDKEIVSNLSTTNGAIVTVYAQWKANNYTLTYNVNASDATVSPKTKIGTYDQAWGTLATPTRPGYTSNGWFTDTTYKSQVTDKTICNGDITVYAKWQANTNTKYTVYHQQEQLDGSYVTVDTDNLTGTTDTTVTPAVRTYTGFASPSPKSLKITGDGKATLTYRYTRNSYSILRRYRLQNADGSFGNYVTIDNESYKFGYTISAWSRVADATYQAATIDEYIVKAKNDTLSVDVLRKTSNVAINYRLQNADGTYPSTYTSGWSGKLRTGETHNWVYTQTASHEAASRTAHYNDGTINIDIPRRTGRLIIHANGGTGDRTTESIIYGSTGHNVSPLPTRTGYVLDGLYTTATGGIKVVNSDGTKANDGTYSKNGAWLLNSDVDVYAHWTLTPYAIVYNLNGGSAVGNPTQYTVETETFTLINPSKVGYKFLGWTGSNGNNPSKTVTITKGSIGDKTYTANWSPRNYKITYNLDGGTMSGGKSTYTIEDSDYTLPTPTKSGYVFTGWTGSNGNSQQTTVVLKQGSTGNKNYTAHWTYSSSVINFDANGGTGSTPSVTGNYGQKLPEINNGMSYEGYDFEGYYDSNGKAYYDSNNNPVGIWDKTDRVVTLYAHWSGGGYIGKTYEKQNAFSIACSNETVLTTGSNFNTTLKALASSNTGLSFKISDTEPSNGTVVYNIARDTYTGKSYSYDRSKVTPYVTVMYKSGSTIYVYSKADTLYMNPVSDSMFLNCTGFTTIDLVGLDTSKVESSANMFSGDSNLKLIYATAEQDMSNISNDKSSNMFRNCTSLSGYAGTRFNGIITAAYAHLDEGDDYPGYFSTESTKAKQITFDLNGGTLD